MPAGKTADVICAHCGRPFKKPTRFVKPRNYCCRPCLWASRRVPEARWKDPGQIAAYHRDYREKNRERHNERGRLWARNNREKRNENQRLRRTLRSRKKAISYEAWQKILDRYGHKCLRCGATEDLQCDHVVPVSKGGTDSPSNIQPLCGACDRWKQDKTIDFRRTVK